MDNLTGTWVLKNLSKDNSGKKNQIHVVEVIGENCLYVENVVTIGNREPDKITISKTELFDRYTSSNPFANEKVKNSVNGMSPDIKTAEKIEPKEDIDEVEHVNVRNEEVNSMFKKLTETDKVQYVTSKVDCTKTLSPEQSLLNAMMMISPSSDEVEMNLKIQLPLSIDILKSLKANSSIDISEFIKVMLERNSDDVLTSLSKSIISKINENHDRHNESKNISS